MRLEVFVGCRVIPKRKGMKGIGHEITIFEGPDRPEMVLGCIGDPEYPVGPQHGVIDDVARLGKTAGQAHPVTGLVRHHEINAIACIRLRSVMLRQILRLPLDPPDLLIIP